MQKMNYYQRNPQSKIKRFISTIGIWVAGSLAAVGIVGYIIVSCAIPIVIIWIVIHFAMKYW